jgi:hypothetical protein
MDAAYILDPAEFLRGYLDPGSWILSTDDDLASGLSACK